MKFHVTIECSGVARQNIKEMCLSTGTAFHIFSRKISLVNPPRQLLHDARLEADRQYRRIQGLTDARVRTNKQPMAVA